MKKLILSVFLVLLSVTLFCQLYTPVDEGSAVQFKIKNFGFSTGGNFSGLQGNISFNPLDISSAAFDVTVDSKTVNTDNEMRDEHLRNEDYFDVQNYPVIRFVSSKITSGAKTGNYNVSGKLTIKKTTKDIAFPFSATESNGGFLFQGEFKINRKEFGIGGSSTISDNIEISLKVSTRKK